MHSHVHRGPLWRGARRHRAAYTSWQADVTSGKTSQGSHEGMKETHEQTQKTVGWLAGRTCWLGLISIWDSRFLYLGLRLFCSVLCNNLSGKRIWKRIDTCLTESLGYTPETNTTLLFNYDCESRSAVSDPLWPHGLYSPWNSPGQNTGGGSPSLLQGSSQPRDQTQRSRIAGGFFTCWATRKALFNYTPI